MWFPKAHAWETMCLMWFPKVFELWTPPFEVESIPKDYILQCILHAIIKNPLVFFSSFPGFRPLEKDCEIGFQNKSR